MNSVLAIPFCSFEIYFNYILASNLMSSKRSSSFATKTSYASLFFPISANCLAQLILLDLITRIKFVALEWPKLGEEGNIKIQGYS